MKRCEILYCLGTPQPGRKKCPKCRMREWRKKNPTRDAYSHFKSNAKRRGIPFKVTYDYWVLWCWETDYLNLRGLEANDMTIDCNDNYVGYYDGGFTMKSKSDNSREGRKGKPPEYKPDGVPF